MPELGEVFGSREQIMLMERGNQLWTLLRDDPRYSFYGRMVSLCQPDESAVERTAALARLQGATSCQYYPASDADGFRNRLIDQGLRADRYEQCRGGRKAYETSKRILSDLKPPDDLTVHAVDGTTTPELVADIAQLSIACGVMPVPGSAMRGQSRDGICLAAVDAQGGAVATASAYMSNHATSPRGTDAFWGMLATRDDWRGKRLAQILGAQSIVWMWEKLGARSFNTGVTADNTPSMTLCAKLEVTPSQWTFIGCMDPETFGTASVTR